MLPDFSLIPELLLELSGKVLQIRESNYTVERKLDNTFVTSIDLFANQELHKGLRQMYGKSVNIVSEENTDLENAQNLQGSYFLIDPIDGTSILIRGGNFCINVSYMVNHKPVFGAIAIPPQGQVFYTANNNVYKKTNNSISKILPLQNTKEPKAEYTSITNRRHIIRNGTIFSINEMRDRLTHMGINITQDLKGAAAVKYCMLAENIGDMIISLGTLRSWDLSAAHIILETLGIKMTDGYGHSLDLSLHKKEQVIFASSSNFLIHALVQAFKNP